MFALSCPEFDFGPSFVLASGGVMIVVGAVACFVAFFHVYVSE